MHDYTALDLSPRLEAILNYATLLAREPYAVQEDDLHILRQAGLSDEEILSVVLITCTFSFMTRLADGLGVELDDRLQSSARTFVRGDSAEQTDHDSDWLHKGKASRGAVIAADGISGVPQPDAPQPDA